MLTIPVVEVSDAGRYRCAAMSEAGSFLADVTVVVESRPIQYLLFLVVESL